MNTNIKTPTQAAQVISCAAADIRLSYYGDQVHALVPGQDKSQAVRLVWLRPVSARHGALSILDEKKKEICYVDDISELHKDSFDVAVNELQSRYPIATVKRVVSCKVILGNRYFDCETNLGRRLYLIKDPSRNITWLNPDHLLIRDVQGNRFEITSLKKLDAESSKQLALIL